MKRYRCTGCGREHVEGSGILPTGDTRYALAKCCLRGGKRSILQLVQESPALPIAGTTGRAHPGTSIIAHELIDQVRARKAYRRILELLELSPSHDEPMMEALAGEGLSDANGFRARRGEIAGMGLIEVLPGATAPTRSGRMAQIWRLTGEGRRVLGELRA